MVERLKLTDTSMFDPTIWNQKIEKQPPKPIETTEQVRTLRTRSKSVAYEMLPKQSEKTATKSTIAEDPIKISFDSYPKSESPKAERARTLRARSKSVAYEMPPQQPVKIATESTIPDDPVKFSFSYPEPEPEGQKLKTEKGADKKL